MVHTTNYLFLGQRGNCLLKVSRGDSGLRQFSVTVMALKWDYKHKNYTGTKANSFCPIQNQCQRMTTSDQGDFAEECLKAHNEYREKHGVPPLTLNQGLCNFSKQWAENLAGRGVLQHRQNSGYGENIFCSSSSDPSHHVSGRAPVDNWYSEIGLYPFGREPANLSAGHFSQVVWRDSKELGVGFARSHDGKIFIVANYSPPGNYVGRHAQNVPPPV